MTSAATCPACRSRTDRWFARGASLNRYRIARCTDCGLAFAWPRPDHEELHELYSAPYFDEGIEGADRTLGYDAYDEIPEHHARRTWFEVRSFLFDLLPETGRVLDIGCATGGMLVEARREGWEVLGTELSAHAAARATSVHGLTVQPGRLLPGSSDGPFDLVTMWHVLEHLVDPAEAIAAIRTFVERGAMLVVELPNWDSAGRLVRRTGWDQLRPPEHINFFGSRPLERLLRANSFEVVRSVTRYPSVTDLADRVGGWRWGTAAVAAEAASRLGRGGYLRTAARAV